MLINPSESAERTQQFEAALKDGAFDFILSLSADVKPPIGMILLATVYDSISSEKLQS